jgi:hypothetical protein
MTRHRLALGLTLALSVVGASCGGAEPTSEVPRTSPDPAPSSAPSPKASASAGESPFGKRRTSAEARAIRNAELQNAVLAGVSGVRGLPKRGETKSRTLSRKELLEVILAKEKDGAPKEVMRLTGEALVALELAPASYDFEAGVYELLQSQIAGLYDPDDKTMYLLDDLSESSAYQTLAHELVHALQDQSFDLGGLLDWKPRKGDETAAIQTLIEGDATVAMFAFASGDADAIDEKTMRRVVSVGAALSAPGTPAVLVRSLVAPYTDGFAAVQGLRRKGGWGAVDRALRTRPTTTEQVLHLDKLDKREPALFVPDPPLDALGAGFTMGSVDVMGEQGARIAFEEWTSRTQATEIAAGWGGDAFAVATRDAGGGNREVALAWHHRTDTAKDAKEIADLLAERFGKACKERPDLGPITWIHRGRDVVVTAGPFVRRADRSVAAAGSCDVTSKWARAILDAKPSTSGAPKPSKPPAPR